MLVGGELVDVAARRVVSGETQRDEQLIPGQRPRGARVQVPEDLRAPCRQHQQVRCVGCSHCDDWDLTLSAV